MEQACLIKRCQLDDKQAFEELYQRYCHQALKTAYLISGDPEIAEDIVQETFIQCFKSIKQLKEPDAFYAWFYKTLIRCGWRINAKYRQKKLKLSVIENEPMDAIDRNFNLEDIVETKEVYDLIQKALMKLTAPMRAAVTLYYYNDMTISEIAVVLDCFQGTVKSRLHNAKKILEKELERYFLTEDIPVSKTQRKESILNG